MSGRIGLIRRFLLPSLLFLLCLPVNVAAEAAPSQWPLHDDGLNKVVQWDHYSFKIRGKRAFMFAGEMHYWRLPVPELWEDILQKMKAAGLNAFTFYAHWGWHAPTPHSLDFTNGAHNFTRLYELAHKIGLYVFIRPGPYINAEANAGGFPLWITNGKYGSLRNNDSRYTAAWEPYQTKFTQLTEPYQITRGGNGLAFQIENEYGEQWANITTKTPNETAVAYVELLEKNARANGIDIPLYANNPNLNTKSWSKDFSNAGGNVDMYGVDNYPSCWSCNLAECTGTNGQYVPYQVVQYYDHFQSVAPTQPEFMPEFQGGSYNPWGGPQGGCLNNSNEDFANLFYRNNIAERVTAMSLYMFYGGTNWGWIAAPVTATSYDYSAPISENRTIGSKYYETKNLALFTRVAEDLTMTNRAGNGTMYTNNPRVTTTELRNPTTNAGFYVVRHTNSSLATAEAFKLSVNTSLGNFSIPRRLGSLALNGHQSKIIVTDFRFGSHVLTYSTAEVLTYAIFKEQTTLVLWVPDGESGEFFIKHARRGMVSKCQKASTINVAAESTGLLVTFENQEGMSVISADSVRVVILDRSSAYPFFAPSISTDPLAPATRADSSNAVLVQGPYLVRTAATSAEGSWLELTGDIINSTEIEVFASAEVRDVSWNGRAIKTEKTSYGSLRGSLSGPGPNRFSPPRLGAWKVHDSLPERLTSYDDSGAAWKDADHISTDIPQKPETLPVLYFDEYGFHNGIGLWRGYFVGRPTGVFLSVQGGTAFGWSAWLNGQFIGSWLGNSTQFSEQGNLTLSFANATLSGTGAENVLLIVQDNSGHDETSGALNPRGILNATLIEDSGNATFTKWKVAGTAGGDEHVLDPMRGALNEGGLVAERLGWHLPGFDDSSWASGSPASNGLSSAGIRFYRTTMPLHIPAGVDVSLAIIVSSPGSLKLRSLLFVNGYQYGRFNPWMGHQIEFPVPAGVLDYNGDNTIGLAVWAQSEEGAQVGVDLKVEYVAESSLDVTFDSSYLRPAWTKSRLAYA
ncbi:hypothetical protein NA57DRAFT_49846 [Rhizodiscina lignyota]|uniref:beta-galactosidase n=1 Tax=Rhizodiscina lignyota TaxID=1504668 RepID=A0A9P4I457_9PEZI|nr:hypothetical protein NA57DRAFT_49846 [Rhizodiscina lignyota]